MKRHQLIIQTAKLVIYLVVAVWPRVEELGLLLGKHAEEVRLLIVIRIISSKSLWTALRV